MTPSGPSMKTSFLDEVHDLVARVETVRLQLCDLFLDVVDREADVVHADLMQIADVRVRQGIRMLVSQELDPVGDTSSRTSVT